MTENQNQEQNQDQNQEPEKSDAVRILEEQLAQTRADLQAALSKDPTQKPIGILQLSNPDQLPKDADVLSVVVKRHLDAYVPKDERNRVPNFDIMARQYKQDLEYISNNLEKFRLYSDNKKWTEAEISIIDGFMERVNRIRSFQMRIPREFGFKALINPDTFQLPHDLKVRRGHVW